MWMNASYDEKRPCRPVSRYPSSHPWQLCSESISRTRPSRARFSSTDRISSCQPFPLASYTSWSRLEAVSSGPKTRKSRRSSVARRTSRSSAPRARVGSWSVVPGLMTSTA